MVAQKRLIYFYMLFENFYHGKRVLVTGHTGFKGAWLAKWLEMLGAQVIGIGLEPEYEHSLHSIAFSSNLHHHYVIDIRDADALRKCVQKHKPEIVFHLAAQALVRRSYRDPLLTIETNVTGTANLLHAVNESDHSNESPCTVIIATSDKCYENRETHDAYREDDRVGGHDIYSMSKGCAELVASAWRRSFFPENTSSKRCVNIATVRAGNVIGGGDWSEDRIVVDCVRSLATNKPISVRNPQSIRPWQHVLEPLSGYLQLGYTLSDGSHPASRCSPTWNFGPNQSSARPVHELCERLIHHWGSGQWESSSNQFNPHEAKYLKLAIEKARHYLNWNPVWDFESSIKQTVDWYKLAYKTSFDSNSLNAMTETQIQQYIADSTELSLS